LIGRYIKGKEKSPSIEGNYTTVLEVWLLASRRTEMPTERYKPEEVVAAVLYGQSPYPA
jgi:hypothetical protein